MERPQIKTGKIASLKHTNHRALYSLCILALGAATILWAFGEMIPASSIVTPVQAKTEVTVPDPCTLNVVDCDEVKPDGKGGEIDEQRQAESFLQGTPMEGLGKAIVDTANAQGVSWKIVIGIAKAESSLGKHYVYPYDVNCANAWGIKPPGGRRDDGSYLRCYYTWQDGINSIVGLLARRYKDQTPEQMCGIYVVPCNENWLRTINNYYQQ